MIKVNPQLRAYAPRITFSPYDYKEAYQKIKKGNWRPVINMFERAEAESHIRGCLRGRYAGIQRDWSYSPYDDSPAAEAQAEWFTQWLKSLDYQEIARGIVSARLKKYRVIDFDWGIFDGKQAPVMAKVWPQKYFAYDQESYILKIDHDNGLQPIPDDVLVVEIGESDIPDMFPVLRDFTLKIFGLESMAAYLETFGEPFIILKYPPGTESDAKKMQAIDDALELMARSTRGKIPNNSEIEFREASSGVAQHLDFVGNADKGIAIALLGHANAVQKSDGAQIGENQEAYKAKRELSVDDLYFIDRHMNRLTAIVAKKNWSDGKYPRFVTDKSDPIDAAKHTSVIYSWYNMGLPIHPDEARKIGLTVSDEQAPLSKTEYNPFED